MNLPVAIPNCSLTRVGLELRPDTTFDQWLEIGNVMLPVSEGIKWCVGDHLNFGNERFASKYAERMKSFGGWLEALGYSKKTLYELAYVANKVPISIRMENLSWTHHHIVASLSLEDQKSYLQKAAEKKWTVKQLREELKLNGKLDGAAEQNETVPEFSPFAWVSDGIREFNSACQEKPLEEWEDERILIIWRGLVELAKKVGGPIKEQLSIRGLEVAV
jgi:hypothetical protein